MHVAIRRTMNVSPSSKCWSELSFIARVALQDPKPTYDAPIHLREPHFSAELCRVARLASSDYARVFLEDGKPVFLWPKPAPPQTLYGGSAKWLAREAVRSGRALLRSWLLRAC